jgi:hypothetical protein
MLVGELIEELSNLPRTAHVEVWHDSLDEEGIISQNVDTLGYSSDENKVVIRVRDPISTTK